MSSKTELISQLRPSATSFRWRLRSRPRLPTIRLGGKKPRRGFFLLRLCKKAKLKWLKLKYLSMLKKLKNNYKDLVKDMIGESGTIESFQQRMLLETSFAIPVMALLWIVIHQVTNIGIYVQNHSDGIEDVYWWNWVSYVLYYLKLLLILFIFFDVFEKL